MNTDEHRRELDTISSRIIGCSFTVSNTLGCGFLEKVHENALAIELRKVGLAVRQQHPFAVRYKGEIVGEYVADLLVEERVLVELKAVKTLDEIHTAQCLNYLKATGLPLCLLFNFGNPHVERDRFAN
jgi:GxxExxY protein